MSSSNLFKPNSSSAGIGKKSRDKGQFANPPEYTDIARMTGSSIKDADGNTLAGIQKTPSARKGRV